MIINTNMASINAQRNLGTSASAMQKSLEKLSSGYRINRAADDAAGLAISEKLRGQIRGVNQAQRNAQDGISLLQTAEGALNVTHSILQRMRELSVQASNGTLDDEDRTAIITEMTELVDEIDRIAKSTQFNKKILLDGSFGAQIDALSTVVIDPTTAGEISAVDVTRAKANETYTISATSDGTNTVVTLTDSQANTSSVTIGDVSVTAYTGDLVFDNGITISANAINDDTKFANDIIVTDVVDLQIGANEGVSQRLNVGMSDMTKAGLSIDALDLTTTTGATQATTTIDAAIQQVSLERSTIGAWQNRLEHTIENLSISSENMTAAESRIRDVDMAKAMSEFTRQQILNQASVAMLAQANQTPQAILKLLG